MLVKDVMQEDVLKISAFSSVREALSIMKKNGVKSLVVDKMNPHDAYGIITYTSILKEIVADDGDIDLLNVYDIYTKPALSISKELDVKHVAKMMVTEGYKRLLVADNNELDGIISMTDIIDVILDLVDEETN